MAKYGAFPPTAAPGIAEQVKSGYIEKYGVEYYLQSDECRRLRKLAGIRKTYGMLEACDCDKPNFSVDALSAHCDGPAEYEFRCSKCGNIFKSAIGPSNGMHSHCPDCFPGILHGSSRREQDVVEFLKSQTNTTILTRTRKIIKPFELGIYMPDARLAVEFDGLYWHCEDVCPDKNYHLQKTEMCELSGIRLIHIFEDEWMEKNEIVKSRLADIVGANERRTVYARSCRVCEVENNEARAFQDANHLQGGINSSVRLGLYDKDELIALMTFGKCRFDKRYEWEMLRFCCRCGCHVPGAAGRLLMHFERNWRPKSLVSYADRRWSQGNLYMALGFSLDHISKPNYWYINCEGRRKSRLLFQKHKLKKMLKTFDETKSEVENMRANGWHRIFDCGNLVFVKTY